MNRTDTVSLATLLGGISHDIVIGVIAGPPSGGGTLRGKIVNFACSDASNTKIVPVDFIDIRPDIIEPHVEQRSEIGLEFLANMSAQNKGTLQPDAPILKGLALEMKRRYDELGVRQFLLRGFPRTPSQAQELLKVGCPVRTVFFDRTLDECKQNFFHPERREENRADDLEIQQLEDRFNGAWMKETVPALEILETISTPQTSYKFHRRTTPEHGPDLADDVLYIIRKILALSSMKRIKVIANLADNKHKAGNRLNLATEQDRSRLTVQS